MSRISEILEKYWGYTAFRPLQEEVIQSVMNGNDTVGLLPTGAGKSICYQVPAIDRGGLCLVVTPLIALMKDQVESLKKRSLEAVAVYSGMSAEETSITLDNCIYGKVRFLFVSPERLGNELFLIRLKKMKVSLLVVDEAHCISQWGYDFRPSYLRIAGIREFLPGVPLLALTATATTRVMEDICEKLELKTPSVWRGTFQRPNLVLMVRKTNSRWKEISGALSGVGGPALIYAASRRRTKEIAELLQQERIRATYYHAGLDQALRAEHQREWMEGHSRVMVATNAFGMGIDKADVRLVIHDEPPETLEAYYQESGRAGRDGKKAWSLLLYSDAGEMKIRERRLDHFPTQEEIREVYQSLANHFRIAIGAGLQTTYDFDLEKFSAAFRWKAPRVHRVLQWLQTEGLVDLSEPYYQAARMHVQVSKEELYRFEVKNAAYQPLVAAILRKYPGVINQFVNFGAQELAYLLKVRTGEISQQLLHLERLGLLKVLPKKELPQLTFLHERADARHLQLNPKLLAERTACYGLQQEALLEYLDNSERCRSVMLAAYFGETGNSACGKCDVCVRQKKQTA